MQVAALYLFYLIAKRFLGDPWALSATMILGFDTVFFIHGGALLIDMPSFLFSFLAIELYFRKRYGWSATSMGLAFLSREMSIFAFVTLAAYHLAANKSRLRAALKLGLRYTLLALLVFGSLLWLYDLSYRPPVATYVTDVLSQNVLVDANGIPVSTVTSTIQITSQDVIWNPIQHVLFIYRYHGPGGIVLAAPYAPYQYAWNWILPIDPFNSPTYYGVSVMISTPTGIQEYSPISYVAQANLALWYGIWPAIVGLIVAFKQKKEWATALFMGVGIASNYAPWLTLSLLTRRIGFNYYMIYTLPYIALALSSHGNCCPPNSEK
jgi:4-amino-4-deoxy-L-arabinose transferase-like glycosyltransferase